MSSRAIYSIGSGGGGSPVQLGGTVYSAPVNLSRVTVPSVPSSSPISSVSVPKVSSNVEGSVSALVSKAAADILSTAIKSISSVSSGGGVPAGAELVEHVELPGEKYTSTPLPSASAASLISNAVRNTVSMIESIIDTSAPVTVSQPKIQSIATAVSRDIAKITDDLAARIISPDSVYTTIKNIDSDAKPVATSLLQQSLQKLQGVVVSPTVTSSMLSPKSTVLTSPEVSSDIKLLLSKIVDDVKREAATNVAPKSIPQVPAGSKAEEHLNAALSQPNTDKDYWFFGALDQTPEEYMKSKEATKAYMEQKKWDPFTIPLREQLKQTGTVVISPEANRIITTIEKTFDLTRGSPIEVQDFIIDTSVRENIDPKHIVAAASAKYGSDILKDASAFKSKSAEIVATAKSLADMSAQPRFRVQAVSGSDMDRLLNEFVFKERLRSDLVVKLRNEPDADKLITFACDEHPLVGVKLLTGEIQPSDIREFLADYEYISTRSQLGYGFFSYDDDRYASMLVSAARIGFTNEEVKELSTAFADKFSSGDRDKWLQDVRTQHYLDYASKDSFGSLSRENIIRWMQSPENQVLMWGAGVAVGAVGGLLTGGPVGAVAGALIGGFAGTEMPNLINSDIFAKAKESQAAEILGTENVNTLREFEKLYGDYTKQYNNAIKEGDLAKANEIAKSMSDLNDQYARWVEDNYLALFRLGVLPSALEFAKMVDVETDGRIINRDASYTDASVVPIKGMFSDVSKVLVNGNIVSGLTSANLKLPPGSYEVEIVDRSGTSYKYKVDVNDSSSYVVKPIASGLEAKLQEDYNKILRGEQPSTPIYVPKSGQTGSPAHAVTWTPWYVNLRPFRGEKVFVVVDNANPDIVRVYDYDTKEQIAAMDKSRFYDVAPKMNWDVQFTPPSGTSLELPSELPYSAVRSAYETGVPVKVNYYSPGYEIFDPETNTWGRPDYVYVHQSGQYQLLVRDKSDPNRVFTAVGTTDPRLSTNFLEITPAVERYPVEPQRKEESPSVYISGLSVAPGASIKIGNTTITPSRDGKYEIPQTSNTVEIRVPGYTPYTIVRPSGSSIKEINISELIARGHIQPARGSVDYSEVVPSTPGVPKPTEYATISLTGAPYVGATYAIDGFVIDPSNTTTIRNVPPGTHILTIQLPGYKQKDVAFTVRAGSVASIPLYQHLDPLPADRTYGGGGGGGGGGGRYVPSPKPTSVTMIVFGETCRNAKILLDGVEVKPEIGKQYSITPGYHAIEVQKVGYKVWRKTVYIAEGDTLTVSPALEPEPVEVPKKRVDINTEPVGAKILIDGKWTGQFTPGYVELEPGLYLLELVKSGYLTISTPLYVGDVIAYDCAALRLAKEHNIDLSRFAVEAAKCGVI